MSHSRIAAWQQLKPNKVSDKEENVVITVISSPVVSSEEIPKVEETLEVDVKPKVEEPEVIKIDSFPETPTVPKKKFGKK